MEAFDVRAPQRCSWQQRRSGLAATRFFPLARARVPRGGAAQERGAPPARRQGHRRGDIWDNDLVTGRQEWYGATEALLGYPAHQSAKAAWWEERVHPDDRWRVLSSLETLYASSADTWSEEYRFRRADGSYATVIDRGCVVRDVVGRAVRMVGAIADVTERRRIEAELRESEELFRATFEAAAVGMAHVAPDGRWLRINRKLCEISGYSREELLRLTFLDLTPQEDLEESRGRVRRVLEGRLGPYTVERRYVRKGGSRVWVDLSVSPVRGGSGAPSYFICVARDITERKLAELVPDPLTCREMEVLRLVVAGRKNPQIANDLRHSLGTVKLDVQRLIRKLGVENRKQAAARAVKIGLISPAG